MGRPLSSQPDVSCQFVLVSVEGVEDVDALRLEYEAQGYATMVRPAPSSGRRALYASASAPRDVAASEVPAAVVMVGVTLALFVLALRLFLPCAFGVCVSQAYPAPPEGARWADCDALDGSGCAMLPTEALSLHAGAPTCIRVTKTETTDQTVGGATSTANGVLCAVTGGAP